jgi:spermidine synthase
MKFFVLSDNRFLHNHLEDGRVFLRNTHETYDVVFQDVFGTDLTLPQHLATREYFALLRKRLTPEGVLFVNYIGKLDGDAPTLTGSLIKTIHEVFPNMSVYAMYPDTTSRLQNIMIVARNGSTPIAFPDRELTYANGEVSSVEVLKYAYRQYIEDDHEVVFTDDRAPVEYLLLKEQS